MIEWKPLVPDVVLFALVFGAIMLGIHLERWRARSARRAWAMRRAKTGGRWKAPKLVPAAPRPAADAVDQLRIVMESSFEKRRILSRSEARVLFATERAIREAELPWRAMAQVSMGEILFSPCEQAYRAINSKRVDILVVSESGEPLAAIEYQGQAHYQGSAPARDAVKKEALRRAGIGYVEVTPEHGPDDIAREIARLRGRPAQLEGDSPPPSAV